MDRDVDGVRGGQGRSAESLVETAVCLVYVVVGLGLIAWLAGA